MVKRPDSSIASSASRPAAADAGRTTKQVERGLGPKKAKLRKERVVTLYEGSHLRLEQVGTWEYAQRKTASGAVAIVAITDQAELLLVEQFRPPLQCNVIELPAGLVGDIPGEEHELLAAAAQRELKEETGFEAEKIRFLSTGPSSAGLSTELISFFAASCLKKVSAGGGDASESITVHKVPLDKLPAWLRKKEAAGCLVDYKIAAGLFFVSGKSRL